ncbi:D-alanyl-D-alanine carboxypeptidase/D-alanyl-D-alanine-endopeptidase [bacterium]|nr:D-alanyl-D-alanine carboxypeptidase/D-alanyl-D-alanine-endopeptidase [bacterium]MCI0603303.1 D-alanyl-D-alanine carboxypeptidase/D-alanyl-D-alanine-endopeptidase [bacterium]
MLSFYPIAKILRLKFTAVLALLFLLAGCAHKAPAPQPRLPAPEVIPVPSPPLPVLETLRPAPDRVAELRARLDRIIDSFEFQNALWGIKIVSLDRNEIWYERNTRTMMLPASNMKIVTAAAALIRLGPDFRYETRIETDGQIVNGRLTGNLIVVGSGDPAISSRMQNGNALSIFRDWAEELRAQGIRRIDGSIIGVDTYFDNQRIADGWPAHALNAPYAAQVSALQFNDNVIAVHVKPGRRGRLASVRLHPHNRYLRLQNRVVTRSGHSNRFVAYRQDNSNIIILRGRIGTRDRTDVRYITVHEPAGYFAAVLKETLENMGIRVRDSRRASKEEADSIISNPGQYRILFTHSSPPLGIIITEMMKSSHNLFADSIAKTIAAVDNEEGSFQGAEKAIRETLAPLGINPSELVMEDGSGLSGYDFVTPNLLAQILVGIYKGPLFPYFYDSLPVAGVDGTLKNRMVGTYAEGNVRAKTGFIGGVRSLSGYVKTRDGERLAFAVIANNFNFSLRGMDAAQEEICLELADFSRK